MFRRIKIPFKETKEKKQFVCIRMSRHLV